jgi:predicted HTH domain antitoxin
MTRLHIDVPDDVLALPGYDQTTLEALAREALLVRLYAEGGIAAHQAARALGIPREAFGQILARYGVAALDETAEVDAEIRRQTHLLQPTTPLGKKLVETRARIIASGERLLAWDELAQEVHDRRGGAAVQEP